ncbi:hypothetical protein EW146_g2422 [Bondarzewia mesenterica]|uniref:Uncharacterized protein n=1 Tax=Bondarzewia mesenterica TaxID=1095465 RepID=A0A4S4M0S8_9AGAM|nr:hypothetical protein EW146_g2422 [Bondarzewia mesenterica]
MSSGSDMSYPNGSGSPPVPSESTSNGSLEYLSDPSQPEPKSPPVTMPKPEPAPAPDSSLPNPDNRLSLSTLSLNRYRSDHNHRSHHRRGLREVERIITTTDIESKKMRRALRAALDQLDQSRSRASHAESIAREMTERVREADNARLAAMRNGSTAREELGMYKVQLSNAQSEIQRAQGLLMDQERLRHEAEASAARARDTARKLQQERLIELAREEGRAMGYREGVMAGQRIGFMDGRVADYDDRRDRHAVEDDEYDSYPEDVDDEGIRVNPIVSDAPKLGEPASQIHHLPFSPPQTHVPFLPASQSALFVPGAVGTTSQQALPRNFSYTSDPPQSAPVRRPGSQPSAASTSTLPVAPGSPSNHNRAPHLPVPHILEEIPEVVNSESTRSRRTSRRGTIYVEPDDDPPMAAAGGADMGYVPLGELRNNYPRSPVSHGADGIPHLNNVGGPGGYQGRAAPVYVPRPGVMPNQEQMEPISQSPSSHTRSPAERQRMADELRFGNTQDGPQLRHMAAEQAVLSPPRRGPPPLHRPPVPRMPESLAYDSNNTRYDSRHHQRSQSTGASIPPHSYRNEYPPQSVSGHRRSSSSGVGQTPSITVVSPSVSTSTPSRTLNSALDAANYLSPNRIPSQLSRTPSPHNASSPLPTGSQHEVVNSYGDPRLVPVHNPGLSQSGESPNQTRRAYPQSSTIRPQSSISNSPRNSPGPLPTSPADVERQRATSRITPTIYAEAPTRTQRRTQQPYQGAVPYSQQQPQIYQRAPSTTSVSASPHAESGALPVPPPAVSPHPAPTLLPHRRRGPSPGLSSSGYIPTSPRPPISPLPTQAALPVPAPSRSPDPLPVPVRRSPYLRSGDLRKSASDATLSPGRPGSPYSHYDPTSMADIASLASASAERLVLA